MKHWLARGLLAGMLPSAFYLFCGGSGMPSIASAAYNLMSPALLLSHGDGGLAFCCESVMGGKDAGSVFTTTLTSVL